MFFDDAARDSSKRYSSMLNSHPQYWPSAASGGQCRHVARMRESMVRAKVSNSTVPTLLQGKSASPLRRRVSWTLQTSMKKRKRFLSSDHSTRCALITLYMRNPSAFSSASRPVSYTHLRAHETDSYLVCRLLLEKKKNNKHKTS